MKRQPGNGSGKRRSVIRSEGTSLATVQSGAWLHRRRVSHPSGSTSSKGLRAEQLRLTVGYRGCGGTVSRLNELELEGRFRLPGDTNDVHRTSPSPNRTAAVLPALR
jgi:hypothetical protein